MTNSTLANLANTLTTSVIDGNSDQFTITENSSYWLPDQTPFFITVTPFGELSTMGNSEIMLVESKIPGASLLRVQRAQKGTSRKAFPIGSIVSAGIYTDTQWVGDNISLPTEAHHNTGTAGGTYRIFNLGSIKIAYGVTDAKVGATAPYSVKFPDGTFSEIPAFVCNIQTAHGSVGGNNVIGNNWDQANQTMSVYWNNTTGNTSVGGVVSFICIGV